MKLKALLLGALATVLSACSQSDGNIPNVDADAFETAIAGDNIQLLDVRTAEEFAEGHIESALNIDVKQTDFISKAEAALTKTDTTYIYCRSGRRSMNAARQLAEKGYPVVNLSTGIIGWEEAGKLVIKQ